MDVIFLIREEVVSLEHVTILHFFLLDEDNDRKYALQNTQYIISMIPAKLARQIIAFTGERYIYFPDSQEFEDIVENYREDITFHIFPPILHM